MVRKHLSKWKQLLVIRNWKRICKLRRESDPGNVGSSPEEAPGTVSPVTERGLSTNERDVPLAQESALIVRQPKVEEAAISPLSTPDRVASHSMATTLDRSETFAPSFWDRAYDRLKENDEKLIAEYEELLSRELSPKEEVSTEIAVNEAGERSTTGFDNTKSKLDDQNLRIRQNQLDGIISQGLRKMDENKTKYTIFGREFVPREQMASAARIAQDISGFVTEAVRASPEASLAWAGVCVILPILTNPSAAEEANQDGFTYVTSRVRFYTELESLLWPSNQTMSVGLRKELENSLVDLYQHILDFQIRTVRRFYLSRVARLSQDMINKEDWKGMLAKIKSLETSFDGDISRVNDFARRTELEQLNKTTDKFLQGMSSLLANMIEDNRNLNKSYSWNRADGTFTVKGGTQNNLTGSGIQFSASMFKAPVHFVGKAT